MQKTAWYYGDKDKCCLDSTSLLYSNRYNPDMGNFRRELDRNPPALRAKNGRGKVAMQASMNTQYAGGTELLRSATSQFALTSNQSVSGLVQYSASTKTIPMAYQEGRSNWMSVQSPNHTHLYNYEMTGTNQSTGNLSELQAAIACCRGDQRLAQRKQDQLSRLENQAIATRKQQTKKHTAWLAETTLRNTSSNASRQRGPVASYSDQQASKYSLTTKTSNPWREQMGNPTQFAHIKKSQVRALGGMTLITPSKTSSSPGQISTAHDGNTDFSKIFAQAEKEKLLRYKVLWEEVSLVLWHLHQNKYSLPADQIILRLHEAMKNTASENPDPRLLSRKQLVEILLIQLPTCIESTLDRLYSGLDTHRTDRVRYARLSTLLWAGYRSEAQKKIMNSEILEELVGPYTEALHVLQRVYDFFKCPEDGSLSAEDIKLVIYSFIRSDDDFKVLQQIVPEMLTISSQDYHGLRKMQQQPFKLQNSTMLLDMMKEYSALLHVFQEQLLTFRRFVKQQFKTITSSSS